MRGISRENHRVLILLGPMQHRSGGKLYGPAILADGQSGGAGNAGAPEVVTTNGGKAGPRDARAYPKTRVRTIG